MVGSFAGRKRRRTDRTWRCRRSGRAGLEPYRAEERLLRLGQENCLRDDRIVEAAAEVHARLDREDLELIDRESRPRQVERVHDLGEVLAYQHDIASPEGDGHPVPAGDIRHARDRALDPHRLAGGLVYQAANVRVERIAGLQTLRRRQKITELITLVGTAEFRSCSVPTGGLRFGHLSSDAALATTASSTVRSAMVAISTSARS